MKNFHALSFVTGLVSGALVLVIFSVGVHLFHPARVGMQRNGNFQMNAQNTARMAERMGMTEADLQKELDAGKTMQQIAQEHGVTFGGRRNGQNASTGSGSAKTGSGSTSSAQ